MSAPPQDPGPIEVQNRHILRQLLLSNQLCKALDKLRVRAEQMRDEAYHGYTVERQLRLVETAKNRESGLREYLTACHCVLYCELEIVIDMAYGSIGRPIPRLCPARIVPWNRLPYLQSRIYTDLGEALNSDEKLYESVTFLEGLAERLMDHNVSSQGDLAHFQRLTMEDPLTYVFDQLGDVESVTAAYKLGDGIVFEHHCDNTMAETDPPQNPKPFGSEQICVRRLDGGDPEPDIAYIIGCKSPAKLTMEQLRVVLRGTRDVSRIIGRPAPPADDVAESYRFHAEKLTMAALVEVFDSMIDNGLEYGVLTTAETYVFLWIDWADVSTLHYNVVEPIWEVENNQFGLEVYYSAIGQLMAFTLLALGSPNENRAPHSQSERDAAKAQLLTWTLDWETAWREMPELHKRGPPNMPIPQPDPYVRIPHLPPPPPGWENQPLLRQLPHIPLPPGPPPRSQMPPIPPPPWLGSWVEDQPPLSHWLSLPALPIGFTSAQNQPRQGKRPAGSDDSNGTGSSEAQTSSTPGHQDDGGASSSSRPPASKKPRPSSQAAPWFPWPNDSASTTQVPLQNHSVSTAQAPRSQHTQAPGSRPQYIHMMPGFSQPAYVDAQQPLVAMLQSYLQQQSVPGITLPPYFVGQHPPAAGPSGSFPQVQMPSPQARAQTQMPSPQMRMPSPPISPSDWPQFCTQTCLRGLMKGGRLDMSCPNAQLHQRKGGSAHAITRRRFKRLVRRQLAGADDDGLVPITSRGGTSVTFKLTLREYGYTLVAKGIRPDIYSGLLDEVYVRPGSCVPIFLGSIKLDGMERKFYHGGEDKALVSFVLLSWSRDLGQPVASRRVQQLVPVQRQQVPVQQEPVQQQQVPAQ